MRTYVEENYATTEQLSKVETDASEALAAFKTEASDTYATTEQLSEWEDENGKKIASIETTVGGLEASIDAKVSNEGTGKQFGWSITEARFALFTGEWDSGAGEGGEGDWAESTDVFVCDEYGVYINGSGTFSGEINANKGVFENCIIEDTCTIKGVLTSNTICSHSGPMGSGEILYGSTPYQSSYHFWLNNAPNSAAIDMYSVTGAAYVSISAADEESDSYITVRPDYVWLSGDGIYINGNAIETASSSSTSSDRNAKNGIKKMPQQYEVLFDAISPSIYKYNNGASGRTHTGFIAQEVDEAISAAGMTRSDFAALCINTSEGGEEHWSLRYDEFVSLNTWQIQKLKARVAELEKLVDALINYKTE